MSEQIPPAFVKGLWDGLLNNMRAYDRAVLGPDEYQRKGHAETTEHHPQWIAKREKFAAKFQAMVEDGLKRGFLERDHCYECGGELVPTTDTSETDWIYDETEAEWKARMATMPPVKLLYGHTIGGNSEDDTP